MVFRKVELDEATDVFLGYCRSKGLAERTLQTYAYALGRLRQWLRNRSQGAAVPSRDDLRSFHRAHAGRWAFAANDSDQNARH